MTPVESLSFSSADHAAHPYRYRLYGVTFASWLSFPELERVAADAAVDAMILRVTSIGGGASHATGFSGAADELWLRLDGIGRFQVRAGREIRVEPASGVTDEDLRVFILSSPMGALLHQRGILALHGSAIVTDRGATLFLGSSGRGKSALAAEFARRGFRVLTDDIAALTADQDGGDVVEPGFAQLHLWPDALLQLGHEPDRFPRRRPALVKRVLPLGSSFHSAPWRATAIFVLEVGPSSAISVTKLERESAIQALMEHTYRAQFLAEMDAEIPYLERLRRTVAAVPVFRVQRPSSGLARLPELADRLASHFAA